MRGKSSILLSLAVVSGLGAMYGTNQMLSRPTGQAPVETPLHRFVLRSVAAPYRDSNRSAYTLVP